MSGWMGHMIYFLQPWPSVELPMVTAANDFDSIVNFVSVSQLEHGNIVRIRLRH